MHEYTLRELCEKCGVTRRAVQWYERHGLVESCGKTERLYLLYDDRAVDKVKRIKALQNYGFSISEISEYFGKKPGEQKNMLLSKLNKLREQRRQINSSIKEIEKTVGK